MTNGSANGEVEVLPPPQPPPDKALAHQQHLVLPSRPGPTPQPSYMGVTEEAKSDMTANTAVPHASTVTATTNGTAVAAAQPTHIGISEEAKPPADNSTTTTTTATTNGTATTINGTAATTNGTAATTNGIATTIATPPPPPPEDDGTGYVAPKFEGKEQQMEL